MKTRHFFALKFLLISFFFNQILVAQNAEDSGTKDYLKGLTKTSKIGEEGKKMVINPDKIPTYDEQGNLLEMMEFVKLFQSGDYQLDKYVDDQGELKAMVLRLVTDTEKKDTKIPLFRNVNKEYVGKEATDFVVTDIHNQKFSLRELEGKIVILNFWFINCKPCVEEIPELNQLVNDYKDSDVVFLGLARDDKDHLQQFLKKRPFEYNMIPQSQDIAAKYGVSGYPAHVVIDKDGTIVYYTTGLSNLTIQELQVTLKKLLD